MKKVIIIFILITCLFFWPVFLKGWVPIPGDFLVSFYAPWQVELSWPSKNQGHDVIRQLYPWKALSLKMIKEGQIPLWNPYAFSGNPHLANFQTAIFYPGNLFFLLFSQINAWIVLQMLQFFLAGFFFFLFCRKIGIAYLSSLLASISFSFSLFMVVWSEYNTVGQAALWAPLALLSIEEIFNNKKFLKWLIILITALTFSFFAGHLQVTLYVYLLTLAFTLFKFFEKRERRALILVGLGFLATFFLTAIQWFPTFRFYLQAARATTPASYIFERGLLPIYHLVTLFAPDFFGNPATKNYFGQVTYIEAVSYFGTIPLFLAVFAMFWRREKRVVFWTIIFFLGIFLSLKNSLTLAFYSLNLPVLGTSSPTRILFLTSFSGAILAGLGLDKILTKIKEKALFRQILSLALLVGLIYLLGWLWALTHGEIVTIRNLVLPTGFFVVGLTVLLLRKQFFLPLLLFLTTFDLFYYGAKITPFVPRDLVFPKNEVFDYLKEKGGIDRFFGFGNAYIDTNFSTYYQVFNPEGYDPLFINRYGQLISAGKDGKIKKEIPRSDVNFEKVYPLDTFVTNPYRRRLFSLLGVKYIITKKEPLTGELFNLLYQGKNFDIWEYKEALPRVFLTGDYLVERDSQKIVDKIMDPTFSLRDKIILEEKLPEGFSLPKKTSGMVTVVSYKENQVRLKTKSEFNQILFLSDNFYPGWKVTIDRIETKIYRADFSFRAVAVPKGEHEIVFSYETIF